MSEFPTLQRRLYSGSEIIYQENGRIHYYRADESKGLVKLTKTQKGRDAPAEHYFKLLAIVCRFLVHPKIRKKYKLPTIDCPILQPVSVKLL